MVRACNIGWVWVLLSRMSVTLIRMRRGVLCFMQGSLTQTASTATTTQFSVASQVTAGGAYLNPNKSMAFSKSLVACTMKSLR